MQSKIDVWGTGKEKPFLFDCFPELEGEIGWIKLVNRPTRLRRLLGLEMKLRYPGEIWVKMDGETSDFYGGNKVRKLEFVLGDVVQKGKKVISSFGGIGTNFGVALACHASNIGLKTFLHLVDTPYDLDSLKNLKLMHQFGAKMMFHPNDWKLAWNFYFKEGFLGRVFTSLFKNKNNGVNGSLVNGDVYRVTVGGSSPLGILGHLDAMLELKSQIDGGQMPEPDEIYVPFGSGGTVVGLALGAKLVGLKSRIYGVRVIRSPINSRIRLRFASFLALHKLPFLLTRKKEIFTGFKKPTDDVFLDDEDFSTPITRHIPQMEHKRISKLWHSFIRPGYTIVNGFLGKGYAHHTPEAEEAINLAMDVESLQLDNVYTGKAFAAMIDNIKKGGHWKYRWTCRLRKFSQLFRRKNSDFGDPYLDNEGAGAPVILFWNTLNSVPYRELAASINWRDLPPQAHHYFRQQIK